MILFLIAAKALLTSDIGPKLYKSFGDHRGLFLTYTEEPKVPEASGLSLDALRQRLKLVRTFATGKVSGYVWDDSELLPVFLPSAAESRIFAAAADLSGILRSIDHSADSAFLKPGQTPDGPHAGVPISELPSALRSRIRAIVPDLGPAGTADDARLALQFGASMSFTLPDGHVESFPLRPGGESGSFATPSATEQEAERRVPSALSTVLRSHRLSAGGEFGQYHISDLAQRLQSESGVEMVADARIERRQVFVARSAQAQLTLYDLALALANAMDMFWRNVGGTYLLAVSPEDPRAYVRDRFQAATIERLRPAFEIAQAKGFLPSGLTIEDLMRGDTPLVRFDPAFLNQLAGQIEFDSDPDRERFRTLVESGALRNATISFSASATPYVVSDKAHVGIGGYVFYFGN